MNDPNLTQASWAALLDGTTEVGVLSDEALLEAFAEFTLTECALPPAGAVTEEMDRRGLNKAVTITLSPCQAVRLAYLFDNAMDLELDDQQFTSSLETLACDEYYQLPYPFYLDNNGWRGRAAACQGQPI